MKENVHPSIPEVYGKNNYLRRKIEKVLPLIYDESLSYYEVLCKLAMLIKEVEESKVDNKYEASEAGKVLGIDSEGNVVPVVGGTSGVNSVNGKTGEVVLDSGDIEYDEGTTIEEAINEVKDGKVDNKYEASEAGKILGIDNEGNVVLVVGGSGGAVLSVNSKTGAVILDGDDIQYDSENTINDELDFKADTAILADVAFTGDYNDLDNIPTPSVPSKYQHNVKIHVSNNNAEEGVITVSFFTESESKISSYSALVSAIPTYNGYKVQSTKGYIYGTDGAGYVGISGAKINDSSIVILGVNDSAEVETIVVLTTETIEVLSDEVIYAY